MPDFLLRGIDNAIADRIKAIARERNWAINDVLLHVIRVGLGVADDHLGTERQHRDIAVLSGTWAADEAAAFRSALEAFESLPEDASPVSGTGRAPSKP